jgi:hypothetical protein
MCNKKQVTLLSDKNNISRSETEFYHPLPLHSSLRSSV